MMDFLVRIEVRLPHELPPDEVDRLYRSESARARELAAEGMLYRLWRLPGRRANVGVWRAPDATALHAALSSLPLFPYMRIRVTALADHPNDPGR